jgi:hypothetical protein
LKQTNKPGKGAKMEFRITAEEALEMAKFEAEANCDISAGAEWGTHLDQVMALALNQVNPAPLVEVLSQQIGDVLTPKEIEDLVANFQAQAQAKVIERLKTVEKTA